MTIAAVASLLGALLLGILVGLAFFGSLRWVVSRLPGARAPGLWVAGSATVRVGLVVLAFYLIGQGQWQRMVAALAGFLIGRTVILRVWGREMR